ncbi:hypothetical protein [Peribacillus sp. SCS-155]|uniref:hypothetical protein n=1 Tax=Peribacillus sedimenti TaxID=3115297 RepID=UPI003905E969
MKIILYSIDLLSALVPEGSIYNSKLLAHLEWKPELEHLIVATTLLDKRYLIVPREQDIDLGALGNDLYFYEITRHSSGGIPNKFVANTMDEKDWLGSYSFLLNTRHFKTRQEREVIEKNNLTYLQEPAQYSQFLKMELRLAQNNENGGWGFCWAAAHSPFLRDDGVLCPKVNCATETFGVIWLSPKDAEIVWKAVLLIISKFGSERSNFRQYPTAKDFMEDFVTTMKKLSDHKMQPREIDEWSSLALSQYSIGR